MTIRVWQFAAVWHHFLRGNIQEACSWGWNESSEVSIKFTAKFRSTFEHPLLCLVLYITRKRILYEQMRAGRQEQGTWQADKYLHLSCTPIRRLAGWESPAAVKLFYGRKTWHASVPVASPNPFNPADSPWEPCSGLSRGQEWAWSSESGHVDYS